jgi:hypothetical protein
VSGDGATDPARRRNPWWIPPFLGRAPDLPEPQLQMLSRTFMVTCTAAAFVVVTEELPREHRGWGIGILGALGSFGHGVGLLLFAVYPLLAVAFYAGPAFPRRGPAGRGCGAVWSERRCR